MSAQPRWYMDIDDDFLGPIPEVKDNTPQVITAKYKAAKQAIKEAKAQAKAEHKAAKQRYSDLKEYYKVVGKRIKEEYEDDMKEYKKKR